jgi:hypothetical protein
MNTMIDSDCLVKSAPRRAGHPAKSRNAGNALKQIPEAMAESPSAKINGRETSLVRRLDSEAFRAALQERASAPLYIPNQPRHWGLNE